MIVSRAFEALASRKTTIGLVSSFCVLAVAGLFVPQGLPSDSIAQSYPTAFSQLILALDLHQIMSSWAMQMLAIVFVLHLLASLIEIWFYSPVERSSASRFTWVTAQALRSSGAHPDEFLRRALPGWRIRLLGGRRAVATRGLGFIGFLLVVLGLCLLTSSWILHGTMDQAGRIQLITGPLEDDATTGWYSAEQHDGERYRPWELDFQMACESAVGSELNATRKCRVTRGVETSTVDLVPGRDLQIDDYRLTLVGIEPDANVGGFEVIVSLDGREQRSAASIGTPVPVISDGKEIAVVLVSGLNAIDPVSVVPVQGIPSQQLDGIEVSIKPRTRLVFSVSTHYFHWVTIGGSFLLILGLLFALLIPGYRVYIVGDGDDRYNVSVRWNGGLARPVTILSQIHQQLGTDQS